MSQIIYVKHRAFYCSVLKQTNKQTNTHTQRPKETMLLTKQTVYLLTLQ